MWSSGNHPKCSPQDTTVCTHQESSGFQMKGKLPNPSERGALIPALPSLITLPRKHLQPRRAHFTEKINGWEGQALYKSKASANGQNQPKLWLSHHQEWGIFSILACNGKRFKLPIHVHLTWAVGACVHTCTHQGVMLLESTVQIFIQPKPHCFLPPDEVLLMKCN